MIFCIPCSMLLIIFGIIGLFFPKYRPFVKEAWKCFVNKLMMRKCEASFDTKVKASLVAYFMKRGNMKMAKFVNKYFNIIVTIFGIIIVVVSIYLTYLFVKWIILGQSPCTAEEATCKIEI